MAVFISLANSLFEEYYWRAFLVSELRVWLGSAPLVCIVAGVLFGLHHAFAMGPLFDWPVLVLCVGGTMAAGAVWTWMRVRGNSILDCYVSHVLADLAIMWIGWDLLVTA